MTILLVVIAEQSLISGRPPVIHSPLSTRPSPQSLTTRQIPHPRTHHQSVSNILPDFTWTRTVTIASQPFHQPKRPSTTSTYESSIVRSNLQHNYIITISTATPRLHSTSRVLDGHHPTIPSICEIYYALAHATLRLGLHTFLTVPVSSPSTLQSDLVSISYSPSVTCTSCINSSPTQQSSTIRAITASTYNHLNTQQYRPVPNPETNNRTSHYTARSSCILR